MKFGLVHLAVFSRKLILYVLRFTSLRHIALGDAARDKQEWAKAEEHYKQCLNDKPSFADIWIQLGHVLKEQTKYKEAEGAYRQAMALGALKSECHLQLGHLHKLAGKLDAAEKEYLSACKLDPAAVHARSELLALGWPAPSLRKVLQAGTSNRESRQSKHNFVIDLSDAIEYLGRHSTVTGIQRVQLSLAAAALDCMGHRNGTVVFFDVARNAWVEVSSRLRKILLHNESAYQTVTPALIAELIASHFFCEDYVFEFGATLINFGTSWQYPNYFLAIRDVKARFGVRYVAFVHDCIPLVYPDLCDEGVPLQFWIWVTSLSMHADLLLANSHNTKADLAKYLALGQSRSPPIEIVHLNARFDAEDDGSLSRQADAAELRFLRTHKLDAAQFVLFVSTIEPRKNHAVALEAWLLLLRTSHRVPVPKLVCVGKWGWKSASLLGLLERQPDLKRLVLVLTEVSDAQLAVLYRYCLFTIYPSLYEGWGLPISEALSFGKVPIVSNVASHAEAGGQFGVYFQPRSPEELCLRVMELLNEPSKRIHLEREISKRKLLRSWNDIAHQVIELCRTTFSTAAAVDAKLPSMDPPTLVAGTYYSLERPERKSLVVDYCVGERCRRGIGWGNSSAGGCSIDSTVDLAFRVSGTGTVYALSFDFSAKRGMEVGLSVEIDQVVYLRERDASAEAAWRESFMVDLSGGEAKLCEVKLQIFTESYSSQARLKLKGFTISQVA